MHKRVPEDDVQTPKYVAALQETDIVYKHYAHLCTLKAHIEQQKPTRLPVRDKF